MSGEYRGAIAYDKGLKHWKYVEKRKSKSGKWYYVYPRKYKINKTTKKTENSEKVSEKDLKDISNLISGIAGNSVEISSDDKKRLEQSVEYTIKMLLDTESTKKVTEISLPVVKKGLEIVQDIQFRNSVSKEDTRVERGNKHNVSDTRESKTNDSKNKNIPLMRLFSKKSR